MTADPISTLNAARHADVRGIVHDVIATILPGLTAADLRGDRHIRDLGADSVERIEILLSLLGRLGLDVPLASFSDLPDIDALVAFLGERREM